MKTKELNELKNKTVVEIEKELSLKRQALLKATKESFEGKDKNVRSRKAIRRDIAQILTIKGIIESLNTEK